MHSALTADKNSENQNAFGNRGSYYALVFLINLCFIHGITTRMVPLFDKAVIVIFFAFALVAIVLEVASNKSRFLSMKFLIALLIIFATLAIDVFHGSLRFYLLEFGIFLSFAGPLVFLKYITSEQKIKLLYIIAAYCSIQVFFDLIIPDRTVPNLADMYMGTFTMGNNKARYLFLIAIFLVGFKFSAFRSKFSNNFVRWLVFILASTSCMLGFSDLVTYIGIGTLILSLFIRNIWVFLITNVLIVFGGIAYINSGMFSVNDLNYEMYTNFHRFLSPEHGVLGVYYFGIDKLSSIPGMFGVGFGKFVTRAAQFFGSEVTKDVPRSMVTYGLLLDQWVTPGGLSGFFVLLVELGLFAIPVIFYVMNTLWKMKANNYYGYFSFFYLFYVINFMPVFFEFSEGFLYLATYYLTNQYFINRASASAEQIRNR